MAVIPFYGTNRPDLFAVERRAMDHEGLLIKALDDVLGNGIVLDVGAGNGWTATRLVTASRRVVPLEPSRKMIDRAISLPWVQGEAEHLPFKDGSFDGAYATWAYFFSRGWDPKPGVEELHRVVRTGGPILIADNLGGDGFCELAQDDITADPDLWASLGFDTTVIESSFVFNDLNEAQTLLSWYFGERGLDGAATRMPFRIALFSSRSEGR